MIDFALKLLGVSLFRLYRLSVTLLRYAISFMSTSFLLPAFVLWSFTYHCFNSQIVSYSIIHQLLLRGLCFVFYISFNSLACQVDGLLGSPRGLLPVSLALSTIQKILQKLDEKKSSSLKNKINKFIFKIIFRCLYSPRQDLTNISLRGIVVRCSRAALFGTIVTPHALILAYLTLHYLAFKKISGPFLNFQWDVLLLETGYLGILAALAATDWSATFVNWLMKLLFFRLMLGSGLAKLYSNDESWNMSFRAMSYHFLTQPLPRPRAVWLHSLPPNVHQAMTIATLAVEVVLPVLSMYRGSIEVYVFMIFFCLQASIMSSGHYGFFNLLSIVLSLCLITDQVLIYIVRCTCPRVLIDGAVEAVSSWTRSPVVPFYLRSLSSFLIIATIGGLITLANIEAIFNLLQKTRVKNSSFDFYQNLDQSPRNAQQLTFFSPRASTSTSSQPEPTPLLREYTAWAHELLSLFMIGKNYALFATMTKRRDEVIIRVSRDGKTDWTPVEFAFKPCSPLLPPKPVSPLLHMPRLDWLLWFIALRPQIKNWPEWMFHLLIGILEGRRECAELLHPSFNQKLFHADTKTNPYKFIRVGLYQYVYHESKNPLDGVLAAPTSPQSASFSSSDGFNSPVSILTKRNSYDDEDGYGGASPRRRKKKSKRKMHWSIGYTSELLGPSRLADLYRHTSTFERQRTIDDKKVNKKPMSPDSAAEVIQRRFFRGIHVTLASPRSDIKKDS